MTGSNIVNNRLLRSLPRAPGSVTILCAHPDDEVLFFLGWIRTLRPNKLRFICATDEFGAQTEQRRAEFAAVAEQLGAEAISLGLEDRRGKRGDPVGTALDCEQLDAALASIAHNTGDPVLSHGPIGEYGHRHHVDVFSAAYQRFGEDLWCAAGPLEVHESHELGAACADEKQHIIESLYVSQNGIAGWGCGEESLCHVSSSQFASLFGLARKTKSPADLRSKATLIKAFLESLESHYVGPNRKLPPVTQSVYDAWPDPFLDQMLVARVDDWRRELSV